MKVLYLNANGTLGGAERSLLDMMASVQKTDPSVELHLLVATEGELIAHAQKLGVNVHLLPLPACVLAMGDSALRTRSRCQKSLAVLSRAAPLAWATWRYVKQLKRFVEDLKPHIVHSNSIKFHLLTHLASLRSPSIVWHVRDFLSSRPLMAQALRWAANSCTTAFAISRAIEQDTQAVCQGIPTTVVYNAIDTNYFAPGLGDGRWLDRLAGLPEACADVLRIGLVATFARWKGQDIFLQAAKRVFRETSYRALRFYVVGSPIYQTQGSQWSIAELKAHAPGLLDAQCLGFVNFQENIVEVYRALDVVVHASTEPEPFGRTIVEAMACGRAVIASRAGGAAELFTHDHDAVGVAPGDVSGLASAILSLVKDTQRRQRLAEQARLTAVRRFNRSRLGPQVLEAYRAFLGKENGMASSQQGAEKTKETT